LEIFFVKGRIAFGNFHQLRAIGMAAANRRAEIGEAGGDNGCEIPGSINANLHMHTSNLVAANSSLRSGA
jgi:hypothetical protein